MQLYCTVLLKMSKAKSDWMKVASKSKPGEFYYCNRHTKKCTWTAPPEFQASDKTTCVPQNIAKSAKNATKDQQQQRKELGERGEKEKEKKQPSARAQKPRPPKLNLQVSLLKSNSNNNGNVERAGSAPPPPTTAATDTSMDKDKTLGQPLTSATSGHNEPAAADGDGDIEEMDCEERWGDDGEVSMDFDLSEVQQEQLIAEISATRNTILPATTLDSFSLPSASLSTPLYQEMLYLVLDTNVLISHLQFLVELKDYAIKGVGKPVLVIPWVVMQELDALKTRDNASLASKAKKAIDLLHNCFSANHPRVRGQTMEEVQTESSNIAIGNNDDRILHCCLLYQEKVKGHGGLAVLFSNDIQLCSKAMLNQVRALNRKTLLNELRVLCRSAAHAPPTSYTHTKEYASRVAVAQKQAALFAFIDDLICQSESLVREGLAVIVKSEMVEAYKEIWIQIVIVKPPWSLMDLIHILDKHWIAVFGHVVDRSLKKTVDGLSSYASARHTMKIGSMLELETFHRLSFELLRAFQAKSDYGGVVTYCMTQLSVLGQKAVEAKSGHLPQSSDPSPPPPSPAAVPMTPTQPAPPMSLSIPSNTHPATSPSKLPPTPPVTPSSPSIPFFSVIPTHLEQLVQNIPVNPPDQLPWLLNVIMESIKYCHSHLLVTIQGDKVAAAHILADITKQLAALVAALNNLLRSQLDIQTLGSMVQAFDNFLINTLVVTSGNQSIKFNCPLSLSQLYELLRDSEPHRQLMHSAFAQFMHYLDIFNLLQQSL